ncbi:hypothetical protein FH972_011551 [Carpinus fangiana]|uniref:Uncharacterized protein n=1 Tax=Carpinus fangiana TaxID=176857 RepID=A0A660KXR9_9ROSI|nr:hypothetical protein FH972_011551 [Carpinus fangiana]
MEGAEAKLIMLQLSLPTQAPVHQANHSFPNRAAANHSMADMISSHNGKGSTRSAKSANPTILLDNLNREKKICSS